MWTYECDNDTGRHDEGYQEWYNLKRDANTVGRIAKEEVAKEICDKLNILHQIIETNSIMDSVEARLFRLEKQLDEEESQIL